MDLLSFAKNLRDGTSSSLSIVERCLQTIRARDGKLRAFQWVDWDGAMSAAAAIDDAIATGRADDLSPLAGAPVAVKELLHVNGFPKATAGSLVDVSRVIGGEGGLIRLLKRAGCIIIGTTKTTEFAISGTGVNDAFGTPRNPADSESHRLPGGSSCGSAVAVAAGMCVWAVGTDTGGSIRVPASLCGVVGLKPSVGTFPTDGCFPLSKTYDTVGPLCLSATDAAIIYTTLARLHHEPALPLPTPHLSMSALRFGAPLRPPRAHSDS